MCRTLSLPRIVVSMLGVAIAATASAATAETLSNAAYRLEVTAASEGIHMVLFDIAMNLRVADGPYLYRGNANKDQPSRKPPR